VPRRRRGGSQAQAGQNASVTARHLVGREEELEAIVELLGAAERLPVVAALPGEAGIGKTTLWLAGIDAAASRGYRILSARPSEAETRLSFAGLTDLLGSAAGKVLPELPPIQRRALEGALLLGETEPHADDRAVGAAFLGALQLLAADGPVCFAVDDVQWLDAASLAAVRFALARLDSEAISALVTARDTVPTWLRRAVPEGRVRTIEVDSLSLGAIQELLRTHLDATFPRPTLIRLWETSGGNPFFALELARALQRRGGTLAPGQELPIPSDLDELLRARIDGLSAAALEVARVVAELAEPTMPLVESAVGRRSEAGLAETLDARILELDGERLRFTHPLLGSAVTARQIPSRRRLLHSRLATIVPTAEERARHLALATAKPDREIASILDEAARSAHARGAPATAAELADQALRLTPPADVDNARGRLFLAAERHHAGGDTGRALTLLAEGRAGAAPGPERAAVLIKLADVRFDSEPGEAEALWHQALAEAEGDEALEATIHMRLADSMRWRAGIEAGLAHAALAVRAASRTDDLALRCCALASHGDWHFRAGRGIPRDQMEEALELERGLPDWPLYSGPTEYVCHELVWAFELDAARSLLVELLEVRRARSDPRNEAYALWNLGFLAWRAGNWDEADRYAAESLELLTQLGHVRPPDEFPAAVVAAHRGEVEDARARAHGALGRAEAAGIEIGQSGHGWVLGFIELSLGDPAAALAHLRRSYELRNTFMLEPAMRVELGDLLEALIAVGELDEAEAILEPWQERAASLDRAWSLAILARCRGLLLAARGDLDGAFASFEIALSEHARSTDPFHHARTLLALGRTQRRAKRRRAARTTLDEALTIFERLGAPLWAEQARAELARIGGRTPTGDELTEAESRIARLVAEGRKNREVAAELFLTVHTVETTLTRVYRKLGVRSRAELASTYAAKT
jgi:DNA-binding CsgD family transcriptional regulator